MLVLKTSTESFARKQAGGKGYNLYLMTRLGVPVPEWVAIGRCIYEQFVREAGIDEPMAATLAAFERGDAGAAAASASLQELIAGAPLPASVRDGVRQAIERVSPDGTGMISVRSSAADEDGAAHSFAGQLSSYLYVSGLEDAVRCVRQCWASNVSERALVYRRTNGLRLSGLAVAVVIQRMVDPDASGVLFTCDPVDRDERTFVVSAVYGVGEGLVSGALDADTYWLRAQDGAVERQQITVKTAAFRRSSSGECARVEVDPALSERPCLDAALLGELHRLGRALASYYGRPQDIEWAVADGRVFVLQTRAVTTLDTNLSGFPNLWDNSNIVESYGGPTSPLSFTFALRNYTSVYVQFCEILGVPREVIKDMEPTLGNMLGCIHGRVYYNLYNWYKLVGVLPGFRQNREFMETMMGVRERLSPEIADRIRPHPSWETPLGKWRRLRTGLAFVVYHFRIQSLVDGFLVFFDREYRRFRAMDYRRMSSDRIFERYLEMDRCMLGRWKAPIINDFLCMVHFGMLRKLTTRWLAGLDSNIQNDLLAGEGSLESAEPTRVLIRLAGEAAASPELRAVIEQTPAALLMETLNQGPHQDFYRKVADYVDRFGYRCMSEMKLEETDLLTDPSFLFVCLKNYLRAGIVDLSAYERREKTLRADAEKRAFGHLKGWKRAVYRWSLTHARKAIRNRENTRFARTRAYGVVRTMFQAMGEDLAGRGILSAPDDIFFLTLQEVFGIHQGTLPVINLKDFVVLRRREYARYQDEEPLTRFLTRGPVYWQNRYLAAETPIAPGAAGTAEAAPDALKGLPCCPGVVEGVVKVVMSPRDDLTLNGEILVTARTDPGWVPLYPSVSGLLVERGSLLSHSAIVAREMGIPAIVSIPGLTARLASGMRVRMDGGTGMVTILAPGAKD